MCKRASRSAGRGGPSSPVPAGESFATALRAKPAAAVVTAVCFFMFWSVGGLWSYHTWLIGVGLTTHEHLRETFAKSPFLRPPATRLTACAGT